METLSNPDSTKPLNFMTLVENIGEKSQCLQKNLESSSPLLRPDWASAYTKVLIPTFQDFRKQSKSLVKQYESVKGATATSREVSEIRNKANSMKHMFLFYKEKLTPSSWKSSGILLPRNLARVEADTAKKLAACVGRIEPIVGEPKGISEEKEREKVFALVSQWKLLRGTGKAKSMGLEVTCSIDGRRFRVGMRFNSNFEWRLENDEGSDITLDPEMDDITLKKMEATMFAQMDDITLEQEMDLSGTDARFKISYAIVGKLPKGLETEEGQEDKGDEEDEEHVSNLLRLEIAD